MKAERSSKSKGRRVLVSTLILTGLSAITLGLMINSLAQLTKAFDVGSLLLFVVSAYLTLVLIYSIATIFYNVDKLRGKQKRSVWYLELNSQKEGGSK